MRHRISRITLAVLFASPAAASAAPSPNSAVWQMVDQDVWTVLMGEPQAHLLAAQQDLSNKDAKGAAAEIRRADVFLKIQEKRLAASSRQLSALTQDLESGADVSAKEVEEASGRAISVLDYRQPLIPVMEGSDGMIVDEVDYHLRQAKISWEKNDYKAVARHIREAAAYLKLKAVYAEAKAKSDLLSSAAEFDNLVKKIEGSNAIEAKDLDKASARAHEAVRNVL